MRKLLCILLLVGYAAAAQVPIGNIYSATSWSNLSAFETNGDYSVSGEKIFTPADASQKYLRLPNATMLDTWKVILQTKHVVSTVPIAIALKSINTHLAASLQFYYFQNKAWFHSEYNNNFISSSGTMSSSVGDDLLYTVNCVQQAYTITIENLTTGGSVAVTATQSFSVDDGIGNNTAKLTILSGSASYEISKFEFSSTMTKGGRWGMGNSITYGSFAGSASNRWANRIGAQISSGGGDCTAEMLARTWEIINVIQPSEVFMMIGGNDVLFGVSSATWQANYQSITSQLTSAGIVVHHLFPTPRNNVDETPLRNFIRANYPNHINTFTPFVSIGTALNSTYDSGDGVHPNNAGNILLASIITNYLNNTGVLGIL